MSIVDENTRSIWGQAFRDALKLDRTARALIPLLDHDPAGGPGAEQAYLSEIVSRAAPRWAWEIIDQTLALDAESKAFDEATRADVRAAVMGVQMASDWGDWGESDELPREAVDRALNQD